MPRHHLLQNVIAGKEFYVKDGPTLKNLHELEKELLRMSDASFIHHVNEGKNDFYNWIYHVIKDEQLSARLSKISHRHEMASAVQERILELEKPSMPQKRFQKTAKKAEKRIAKQINLLASSETAKKDLPSTELNNIQEMNAEIIQEQTVPEKVRAREELKAGIAEFAIGLVFGIAAALMIAKALF